MVSAGKRRGCLGGVKGNGKPKTKHYSWESAQDQLEWMVKNLGSSREQLRNYKCRYSEPGDLHRHVGHRAGSKRGQARHKR